MAKLSGYTCEEAAERLDCTPDHVGKLCAEGRLVAEKAMVKLPGDDRRRLVWLISRKDVQRYRREQEARAKRMERRRK